MDPKPLDHIDWRATSHIIRYVWIMLGVVFAFATAMVLAHAMIPSLLDSGHIPVRLRERVRKLRFPLYVVAFMCVGGFAYWLAIQTGAARGIGRFWPRWWI